MILFPAVDLKNGRCVRLEQGDMARATVFNLDPADQARSFAEQGFEYLHVVDLDGAFAGKPMNAHGGRGDAESGHHARCSSAAAFAISTTVEAWLDKGIARVIIGTAAVRDPELGEERREKISRAVSRLASTPATARSRSKAGPRPRR